jgi:hypothetical protein
MYYYVLTFDIDTKAKQPTNHNYVYLEICNLSSQGYTVNELQPSTTYLIMHKDEKYVTLLNYFTNVFSSTDRWTFSMVARQIDGNPIISHTGQQFQCSNYLGTKPNKTV